MKLSFGKTKASLRLEKIVENNPAARRRVSALLSEFTYHMMGIISVRDPKIARMCLQFLKKNTLNKIDTIACFNTEIRMYCKNVVIGRFRAHLNGLNYVVKAREQSKKRLTSKKKRI